MTSSHPFGHMPTPAAQACCAQAARLPVPEVTESDFGAFCDEAEAFCDAEEAAAAAAAAAVHPSTEAYFGRFMADEVIAGLRAAHTQGSTVDWQGYASALEALVRCLVAGGLR